MSPRSVLALACMVCAPLLMAAPASAGEADVVEASATLIDENETVGFWRFDVTVRHADDGWDHYANAFEVLDEHGAALGVRTLFHPHVNEQPFTRSLSSVEIPHSVKRVIIRAHDSEHGYGGVEQELTLPWGE